MASYPNVRQTAEHEGDFSSDFISLHEPIESSTTANAVYPPVIPDGSRRSDNGPSRNRASGAPQEPYLYTHNSETYPPLGAIASGSSESVQSVGRTVQTVDGQRLTAGEDYYGFIRVTKTPIPGDENACVSNVLPTPALQFYENIPPPMEKFGKFIKHPERKREYARCQSFLGTSWTLKSPTPHDLAKAGMFYMGPVYGEGGVMITDQVTCYRCGKSFRGWEEDDDPVIEHLKIYPHCFEENWIEGFED